MKIGILQTGHAPAKLAERSGDYDQIFQSFLDGHGFEFSVYPVVDLQFPPGADAADGWLITGSRHGVYEDRPWIAQLEHLVRDIHAQGQPLIGICFGHQIIAQALGGTVEKFDQGWAIGRTDYLVGGKQLTLNAWHQDQVTKPPDGAQVLGGNGFCKYAMLAYGDAIWTIQPHPEYDAAFINDLIQTRGRGLVPDDILDAAAANLNGPVDNARIAHQMATFFKKDRA